MNLSDYQKLAYRTAIFPKDIAILYCALKLNGEAGEVAEKIGKLYRDHNGIQSIDFKRAMCLELGDVLWYVSALSVELGINLEDVAEANLDKLAARLEKGTLKGSGDDR